GRAGQAEQEVGLGRRSEAEGRAGGVRSRNRQDEEAPGSVAMAQLVGLIVTHDEEFKRQLGRTLRAGSIPVSVVDEKVARDISGVDLIIVDIRGDASSLMATIERLRAAAPGAGIFAVAQAADPNLILAAMRAGANEFFTWPLDEETFTGAIRRTAARRETAQG